MEILENKKLIVDMENKYLFDDKDLIVVLDNEEDFQTLKKYSDEKFSIKAKVRSNSKIELRVISMYSVLEYHDSAKLKKSNSIIMNILEKLGITSSTGGVLILGFEKIYPENIEEK